MKTENVKVGSVYTTKLNGLTVLVCVERKHSITVVGGAGLRFTEVTDFTCRSLSTGRTMVKTARSLTPVVEVVPGAMAVASRLGAELARLEASIGAKVPAAEAQLESELQAIGKQWQREQTYEQAMARS